jgi:hypothetical protein
MQLDCGRLTGNAYSFYKEKAVRNRSLGRSRRRREDTCTLDLREIGCETGKCMEMAHCRVQWRTSLREILNLRIPLPELNLTILSEQFKL